MYRCCTGVEPWCLGKCVVKLVVWAVLQQSNVHIGVVEGLASRGGKGNYNLRGGKVNCIVWLIIITSLVALNEVIWVSPSYRVSPQD